MEQRHIMSPQRLVGHRQVPVCGSFGTPIVDLFGYRQLLLVVLDGLLVEPRSRVCVAYVAIRTTHAGFVLKL